MDADIFIIEQINKIPQLLFNIWLQRNGLQFAKADRLKLVKQKRKITCCVLIIYLTVVPLGEVLQKGDGDQV